MSDRTYIRTLSGGLRRARPGEAEFIRYRIQRLANLDPEMEDIKKARDMMQAKKIPADVKPHLPEEAPDAR